MLDPNFGTLRPLKTAEQVEAEAVAFEVWRKNMIAEVRARNAAADRKYNRKLLWNLAGIGLLFIVPTPVAVILFLGWIAFQ